MVSRTARVRRLLAASACGALAVGLAGLPASPASASVLFQFGADGDATTNVECPLSSGDDSVKSTTGLLTHGTKHRAIALDATFTATGDATDQVHATGQYAGDVAVTKTGSHLASVTVSGHGSVSVDRSKKPAVSDCDVNAVVSVGVEMEFTEGKKGWLYLERSTVSHPGAVDVAVEPASTKTPVFFELYQGGSSHTSARGFVKPGDYDATLAVGLTAGNVDVFKSPPRSRLSIVFHKAGSALRGTKGTGKAYVELPGSVSCGSHRATLRWRPSAGKVASAAIFVNGKKRAAVSTPLGGQKIVLKHLSPRADVTITAKLLLKGGGRAAASRSYVPCRG